MKEPSVLVGSDRASDKAPTAGRQEVAKKIGALIGWLGWVLLVAGGSDFFLTWYPMGFGSPEWEFATVTSSFSVLPLVVIGLVFVVIGAGATGRRWWSVPAAVIALAMLLQVLFAGLLWATNVPIALGAAQGIALTGIKKAAARTALQLLVYIPILGFIALRAIWVCRVKGPFWGGSGK